MKDLPTEHVEGLWLTAVPDREDPRDCFIGRTGNALVEMPPGAIIGTGSLRRAAQVRFQRPDVRVADIRWPGTSSVI